MKNTKRKERIIQDQRDKGNNRTGLGNTNSYSRRGRVCFKRSAQQWNPIIIGDDPIQQVSSAKVLGFHINDKLTWDDHIQKIVAKANSRLHLLRAMMQAKFPKDVLISFYVSSIRSILEYGAPVWNFNITRQQDSMLETIQRRVLKMIDGISPTDHDYDYDSLLQKYNMKHLNVRRCDLCKSLFKISYPIPITNSTSYSLLDPTLLGQVVTQPSN